MMFYGSTDPKQIIKIVFSCIALSLSTTASADVIYQQPKKLQERSTISSTTAAVTISTEMAPIVLMDTSNTVFRVGENLKFVIKYEFIGAGTASMTVSSGPTMNNRPTLHLESKAESNSFIDKFFKVRDVNSSIIDQQSLASYVFHQNLREGNYHVIRNTWLDYEKQTYKFERTKKGPTTTREGRISQPLQDILSSFFFTRTLPLELGQEYAITVFSDEDVYSLKVKVHPKIQDIKVPAGRFSCIRIEPTLVGDAIFKAKEGKMIIWLTNDEHRMPVLLRSKVFIGAFDAELTEYQLGH